MSPRNVHLVGSIPLADARAVFETVSAVLGPRLLRIPDGETGQRSDWISWLEPVFADNPAFEQSQEVFRVHGTAAARTRYRLRPGARVEDVKLENLFYADVAIASYRDFAALKQQGKIPAHCRFQVDLAPAHSVIWLFLQEHLHRALDAIFNDALCREIDKLAGAIAHDQLAIQFDVASAVFARLQRNEPSPYGRDKAEMLDTFANILVGLADHVPPRIELLFHFCYGDANHRHVVEPIDMVDMVEVANRLSRDVDRSIELIHMPVPRDRSDDRYFEPLRRLQLKPNAQLCLGLVHYTDGLPGTRRRLATAEKHVNNFSIATECGFGRRPVDTIPELLRIHAAAAQ
jgi:methionine synthase II (cobalamin-independent)